MAPFGLNLRENAFQVIPNIWFFDAPPKKRQNFLSEKIFWNQKMRVLEELWRFGRHWQMRLENSLPDIWVSAFYDPWRRGWKDENWFFPEFWPKKTYTFTAEEYDTMILWYDDAMTLWHYDTMMLWYYDIMILWYNDTVILWYYGTMILLKYVILITW